MTPTARTRTLRTLCATALCAAALGLGACASTGSTELMSSADRQDLEAAAEGAPVVAVAMVADWCGPCKALEPKFNEAMTTLPYNSVRVIHADYTDRRDPAARATLRAAGLDSLERSNGGTTGVIYLIDADSGEVLGDVRGSALSATQIRERLTDAIAAAR
jgi:thiol-disulfide isomerase/thioredoxin